jgi:hypothetical protein
MKTTIDTLFTTNPHNIVNANCNQVEWQLFMSSALTTSWTGGSLISGSTGASFNYETNAVIDTTSSLAEFFYIKANLISDPATTVSKMFLI